MKTSTTVPAKRARFRVGAFLAVITLAATTFFGATAAVAAPPRPLDPGGGDYREYCDSWRAAGNLDFRSCVAKFTSGGDIIHTVTVRNTSQSFAQHAVFHLYRKANGSLTTCNTYDVDFDPGSSGTWTCYSTRQYGAPYRTETDLTNFSTNSYNQSFSPYTYG